MRADTEAVGLAQEHLSGWQLQRCLVSHAERVNPGRHHPPSSSGAPFRFLNLPPLLSPSLALSPCGVEFGFRFALAALLRHTQGCKPL